MAVADWPGYATAKHTLNRYGLGVLCAANVLGAGSVYILSETGAAVGFALLWVLPLAFALDMVLHDLSARLAADGRPLMGYIRNVLGGRAATAFAVVMALVMQLWAVANYAVAGAAIAWLTGVPVAVGIVVAASAAIGLMLTRKYKRVEAVISALLLALFGAYAVLAAGLTVPAEALATGLVPALAQVEQGTLIIAMLGTTVYYPNFYIQSSIQPEKGWTSLHKYRRDNAAGILMSVVASAAMLTVAAVALTDLDTLTLTAPAQPLVGALGGWALPAFVVGVLAASFTSATGTLFGACYAVPQATGRRTVFGDRAFTAVSVALIALSALLAIALLAWTAFTPVWLAITMPAVNGIIFLPITLLALYGATRHDLGRAQRLVTALAFIVLCVGSVLTARSLATTIADLL